MGLLKHFIDSILANEVFIPEGFRSNVNSVHRKMASAFERWSGSEGPRETRLENQDGKGKKKSAVIGSNYRV